MGHLCAANLLLSWLGHMCIWRDCVAPLVATVWDLNFSDKLKQFSPSIYQCGGVSDRWESRARALLSWRCSWQRILGFMRLFLNPKPNIDILIIGNILPSWPAPISFKQASLAWRMGEELHQHQGNNTEQKPGGLYQEPQPPLHSPLLPSCLSTWFPFPLTFLKPLCVLIGNHLLLDDLTHVWHGTKPLNGFPENMDFRRKSIC